MVFLPKVNQWGQSNISVNPHTRPTDAVTVRHAIHIIHIIQYNRMQYNTIQYNTIQYNTIQYNTAPSNPTPPRPIRPPHPIRHAG